MTKAEMEDAIKNSSSQLDALREILPTLATKQDLRGFATKVEFESLSEDVQNLAGAVVENTHRINRLEHVVAAHGAKLEMLDTIAAAVTGVSNNLNTLTHRLEQKGVI